MSSQKRGYDEDNGGKKKRAKLSQSDRSASNSGLLSSPKPSQSDRSASNSSLLSSAHSFYGRSSLGDADSLSSPEEMNNHSLASQSDISEDYMPAGMQPDYSPDTMTQFTPSTSDSPKNFSPSIPENGKNYGLNSGTSSLSSNNTTSTSSGPKPHYSSISQKLMNKMGYEEGRGLGASQSGRLEPVEASHQKGRRGLGHSLPQLQPAIIKDFHDGQLDEASVEEEVLWMAECPNPEPLSLALLTQWMTIGPKKLDISDETDYCDESILKGVLDAKTVFDALSEREIQRARVRSNPFETIGKVFFQNRAALKMANLDAICGMMFTRPTDPHGKPMVQEDNILYFADVCAAPGGFAEYAIWRRKTISDGFPDVHGFGFTLRSNDFKLHDFYAAPREFFEPHYGDSDRGKKGDGDGDIYKGHNISSFCDFVKTATRGRGVHFMMADGGFNVEGQENIQEILSKQLYLGQFTVALGIVREGGHFVCKLFDTFTPFSVELIYLMYRCFRRVSIHKPNTSRPANSERYIICKGLRSGCSSVYSYLFSVNDKLNELKLSSGDRDVTHLVPPELIQNDEKFLHYIKDMNNSIGEKQIRSLHKIRLFAEDNTLTEARQSAMRTESLSAWGVPDISRRAPLREPPERKAMKILRECDVGETPHALLEVKNVSDLKPPSVTSPLNYRFMVSSVAKEEQRKRGFYLGLGGLNVYRSESLCPASWGHLNLNVELPPDTLIYAELVDEIRDMSVDEPLPGDKQRRTRRVPALHVIDGICLNGFNISKMHLVRRHGFLKRFCEAVTKTSKPELLPLRCKTLHRAEDVHKILSHPRLSVRQVRNSGYQRVMYCESDNELEPYHVPVTGLIMLITVKAPWMMAVSRSSSKKYFYNIRTKVSEYEVSDEKVADFACTMSGSMLWRWRPGTIILGNDHNIGCDFLDSDDEEEEQTPELMSLATFSEFLENCPPKY
ncbi:cap-specific mRNA (nucleoside-2'-O-)-methyltransferase 1 [Hyalella azteca]|uniref:Cap-specific mRNA (nucleoside-2'-O-)-methyltransferase 1 n=1 Tax=Hyalella azteca TaxID=294128 RepID=A0A979FUM9_HYAAZ|nr:cap-specific mRNA (nucleoside-2'-O-)-methyltransferase 1 [Hyalella azteca]